MANIKKPIFLENCFNRFADATRARFSTFIDALYTSVGATGNTLGGLA
jgi:hypothetical protein